MSFWIQATFSFPKLFSIKSLLINNRSLDTQSSLHCFSYVNLFIVHNLKNTDVYKNKTELKSNHLEINTWFFEIYYSSLISGEVERGMLFLSVQNLSISHNTFITFFFLNSTLWAVSHIIKYFVIVRVWIMWKCHVLFNHSLLSGI